MLTNLSLELRKALRKARTYIGPVALTLLITAVAVGMKHSPHLERMRGMMERDFIVTGSIVNAAFLCRFLLEGIPFLLLPLFTCMVFADLLASESADGTLRMLLCRPVTRRQVVVSKYLLGAVYAVGLAIGTGVLAYLIGTVLLGRGSLVLFNDGIWVIPEHTAILRLLASYTLIASGMLAIGSIAFAISTFLSNSNGAIAGAMGVLYGSAVIQEIEFFAPLRPYLLSTHLEKWHGLLQGSFDTHQFLHSIGIMLAYAVVSFVIGLIIFERRDVLA
jgi:ABC-2 type transport system permease protein